MDRAHDAGIVYRGLAALAEDARARGVDVAALAAIDITLSDDEAARLGDLFA